jgi:hypothetical protein
VPAGDVRPICTVVDCTGSLNVAVTAVEVATPVAPLAGVLPVMAGGVVSVAVVSKTTSTQ